MTEASLIRTLSVGNTLGEGVVWDQSNECLWWTDIQSSRLYRYTWHSEELSSFELPERLGSLALVEGDRRLVGAFASGFALFDPETVELQWLYRPEQFFQGTRLNDGRVDRQGRFLAGTMVEEAPALDADGEPVQGSLYSIRGDEKHRVLTGIGISNSLCFSPDGSTMYFADTLSKEIRAYPYDCETGTAGTGRLFAAVAAPGAPDGSTIDADGFLWNAQWDGSRIVRYAPSGVVDFELEVPVSRPTCVCFGGPDLNLLCVTSATTGMSEARLASEPEAGNLLIYQTTVTGLPESRYRATDIAPS